MKIVCFFLKEKEEILCLIKLFSQISIAKMWIEVDGRNPKELQEEIVNGDIDVPN